MDILQGGIAVIQRNPFTQSRNMGTHIACASAKHAEQVESERLERFSLCSEMKRSRRKAPILLGPRNAFSCSDHAAIDQKEI
jgi:hypothetical protein